MFNIGYGIGDAIDGYNQETQVNIDRTNAAEDRDYMRTQRAYQADLQQHQMDELSRQDAARSQMQNLPTIGAAVDSNGTPTSAAPAAAPAAAAPAPAPDPTAASAPGASEADDSAPADPPNAPSPADSTSYDGTPDVPAPAPAGAAPAANVGATPSGSAAAPAAPDTTSYDGTQDVPAPAAAKPAPAAGPLTSAVGGAPAATGAAPVAPVVAQATDAAAAAAASATPQRIYTQEMRLRDAAKIYAQNGFSEQSIAANVQADALGMQRSAKEWMMIRNQVDEKTTPLQLATAVQGLYNSDPMPGQITNIQPTAGGGANITFRNSQTGAVMTQAFPAGSTPKMMDTLESLYSPDTLQARQMQLFQAHLKTQQAMDEARAKQMAEPLKAKPGEIVQPGVGDPRAPIVNTNFRPSAAGAAKPVDPNPELTAAFKQYDFAAHELSDKTPPEQYNFGRSLIQPIMSTYQQKTGKSMPPAVAVDLATRASMHPDQIKPELDLQSGSWLSTITDSSGKQYQLPMQPTIDPKTKLPVGLTPDDAKAKVNDLMGSLGGAAPAYQAAAFDKSGNAKSALINQTRAAIQTQLAQNPGYAKAAPDQQKAMLTTAYQRADSLVNNKLQLVSMFGTPPATPKTSVPQLVRPGGIDSSGGMFSGNDAWQTAPGTI